MTLRVKVVFASSQKLSPGEEGKDGSFPQEQKQQCTVVEVESGATVSRFLAALRHTSDSLQQCLEPHNIPRLCLRFGQPPSYSTLKLCDEQTASMVCPFKSGETVYVECTQRSPVDKADHVPLMGVSKLEDKEKLLKRGGEIYNTITKHAAVENFQVYKIERVFDNSSTHLYTYISYTDSFVKVPEVLLMCPPGERLPLSVLQPAGLVYQIIKKHVSLQHLNTFLLPLFPGRAFIYSAEEDRLCEVEETQVLSQDVQKICFSGITILMLSAWPSQNWSSLPPCSYCTGVCDDPR